ncbi:hypothetical protein CCH79_00013197 [Gambusia affinis]|uniref:Uncharacterized protein n=1 Tax=Gambusia affinis TaxID=33528 RepID=A0A315WRW4_GAMAF|nr:hypothetical protein CCH79_00013197 [Gambusia affinis]
MGSNVRPPDQERENCLLSLPFSALIFRSDDSPDSKGSVVIFELLVFCTDLPLSPSLHFFPQANICMMPPNDQPSEKKEKMTRNKVFAFPGQLPGLLDASASIIARLALQRLTFQFEQLGPWKDATCL